MTTAEAAQQLGVSRQRVRMFIEDGRLRAKKKGRDWDIDPASVSQMAASPRATGNPKWQKGVPQPHRSAHRRIK